MTTVVEDDFTATGTLTALTAWTPTITGSGYTEFRNTSTGIWQVAASGTEANCNVREANVHIATACLPAATAADVDLEFGVGFNQVSGTVFNVGVFARGGVGESVIVHIRNRFSSPDIYLEEEVDGMFTILASGNHGVSINDQVKLELRGASAEVFHNDNGAGYEPLLTGTISVTSPGASGLLKGNMTANSSFRTSEFGFGFGVNYFKLSEFASVESEGFPTELLLRNNTLLRM